MGIEKSFRPCNLADYAGQDRVKKMLNIYIKSAKMRNEALDHVLVYGPSGTGKSTIAHIIANELGVNCITQAAPALKKKDDLIDLLVSLEDKDVLFLDEIHSLNKKMQEVLFVAQEEYYVNVVDEMGLHRQDLPHFTLIGATTDMGKLSEPVLNRFPITLGLTPYSEWDIAEIVIRSCRFLHIEIDNESAGMIAQCSRGIPRRANAYVRRVRDCALVLNDGVITPEVVVDAFDLIGIDRNGLTMDDLRYMEILRKINKPVGLENMASYMNIDKATIENVIEPFLMQRNLIYKTQRGRCLTEEGRNYR